MGETVAGRPAVRAVGAVAAALAAVLVWASGRYGFHRDELYFLACGRHLAWGYPDQPPLVAVLARLAELAAPGSPTVLRLPAVAAAVLVVLVTADLARRFGGGPPAQVLAALVAGTGPIVLLGGRILSTGTIDLAVGAALTWVVVRLLTSGRRAWWLAFGAVLAVGLLNKQLPVVLTAGLVAGLLATGAGRPLLGGPMPWLGGLIAAAAWAPVLWWQASHGWPQLSLARQIRAEYGAPGERIGFVVAQFLLFGPVGALLWVRGLAGLLRDEALARFRALGVAWLVVLAVFVVTAGQAYYPAGAYPGLIAAGAVLVERWRPWARWSVLAAVPLTAALLAPVALPVLPPAELASSPWAGAAEVQLDTVGWPALVDQVAAAYRTIPAPQRAGAVLYAGNYGEAGALEEYGPARGLPAVASSGHNGFADWGPPAERAGPVVAVVEQDRPRTPPAAFEGCRFVSGIRTGVDNEEQASAAVWVCDRAAGGWSRAWTRLRHLSS